MARHGRAKGQPAASDAQRELNDMVAICASHPAFSFSSRRATCHLGLGFEAEAEAVGEPGEGGTRRSRSWGRVKVSLNFFSMILAFDSESLALGFGVRVRRTFVVLPKLLD